MSTRDSDDDLNKYMPDLQAILRESDPAYAEKKKREAMDNPELDMALAELRHVARPKVNGKVKEAPIARVTPKPSKLKIRPPQWLVYMLAVLAVVGPVALVLFFTRTPAPSPGENGAGRAIGTSMENANGGAPTLAPADAGTDADTGAGAATDTDTGAATGAGTATDTDTDTVTTTPPTLTPSTQPKAPIRATPRARPATPPKPTASAAPIVQPLFTAKPTPPPDDTELVP